MNHLWNLVKKEVKELLTPSSVISVVAVCIVLIILGSTIGGEVNKNSGIQPIGYINMDGEKYSEAAIDGLEYYYESQGVKTIGDYVIDLTEEVPEPFKNPNSVLDAMNKHNLSTCIVIPSNYSASILLLVEGEGIPLPFNVYWNQKSVSVFSALSTATGTNAAVNMSKGVYKQIVAEQPSSEKIKNAEYLLNTVSIGGSTFFHGEFKEGVSPDQIYSAISSQTIFVPMIIMLIIVMIGSILISSMGNEKENKTLETLLTLPIGRTTIVGGKLIGCAIAGVVMGAIYMLGMYFYISGLSISRGQSKSLGDLGLALNAGDWVIVALSVFLAIMCALGMCMILGAFAKNYKAAQTYVMPISVLAVIPMFVTMFTSFETLPVVVQGILFLIPFTHPMMILQNIMFGNWALIIGGLVYLVIFAAVMIYITVRLYKSDILLTGLLKNDNKKFSFTNVFGRRQ